jgi:preprotein translocase subunit SecE
MFEADTTTTQVVVMYAIAFVFFFGLAVALVKKNS